MQAQVAIQLHAVSIVGISRCCPRRSIYFQQVMLLRLHLRLCLRLKTHCTFEVCLQNARCKTSFSKRVRRSGNRCGQSKQANGATRVEERRLGNGPREPSCRVGKTNTATLISMGHRLSTSMLRLLAKICSNSENLQPAHQQQEQETQAEQI